MQRKFSPSKSSRQCFFAMAPFVTVDVGRMLTAHVSGIARCGSAWSCPACAPVVRERKARDIEEGLARHLAAGGGAVFVSATMRHHLRDDLAGRLDVMAQFLNLTLSGAPWQRRKKRLGYVGAIKALEVTWGERNGWHPHSHSVLLTERPLTEAEMLDLDEWLYGRWSKVVADRGFGTISRAHGIDVRRVTSGDELGTYLTKVEGGWGVGHELARADLKAARRDGSLNAVGILREFAETGDVSMLRLWKEYEAATFGKGSVVWSPGLRARLLPDVEEVSDEEAAASEGLDVALLRTFIHHGTWRAHVKAGEVGQVLSDLERQAAGVLFLCAVAGVELPALPPVQQEHRRVREEVA